MLPQLLPAFHQSSVLEEKKGVYGYSKSRTRSDLHQTSSYLTVKFTNVRPRHQTLPELLGSVPDQVEAGLLEEECQEAQVAVQILNREKNI